MPIRIVGAGCCLMDRLYPAVDFSSPAFAAARSKREGDGGLCPGRLVFAEDLERFIGGPFDEILAAMAGGRADGHADGSENVGGPSVVSLVHAAQMLEGRDATVSYYGATGDDSLGLELCALLGRTSLDLTHLAAGKGATPSTFVLSDPSWDSGRGERCFVNRVGAAADYGPADLDASFFSADIVALGGTALVPALHEGLPGLLSEARLSGALTIVNTVFDFRAERYDPLGSWPLGGPLGGPSSAPSSAPAAKPRPKESYASCDLLVMDLGEALRLSGERELPAALGFFESSGVGAFVVTRGAESVLAWAGGGRFETVSLCELPVIERVPSEGDTTGCGDNFTGGIIAALALQIKARPSRGLDLADAISWGIAAGAFTLGILGGTYYESRPGEKRELVASYREDWLKQTRSSERKH